ncbi:Beta-glucuronosyltransferase [Actinidia chinensis var. chinensis]|uniref:Beta-glucuronosyltransferase n=1 Tax=Actinidia chinensis var. chinensis TaxID=1590841 RepID=A0A2R6PXG6_ACTCC|nr:Beta-glucuronosyltransferase [Actinidia chinensis var. chinensis]
MMLTTDLSHKMVSKLEQIIVDIGIHLSEQSAPFYAPERLGFPGAFRWFMEGLAKLIDQPFLSSAAMKLQPSLFRLPERKIQTSNHEVRNNSHF